jgi:hypothetical protein
MSKTFIVLLLLILAIGPVTGCGRQDSAAADTSKPGLLASWFGPKTVEVTLPAGTSLTAALDNTLSSKSNSPGDPVRGRVVGNIVSDGKVVVRDGAQVRGVVSDVEGSGRVSGRARISVQLKSIETVDGVKNIQTSVVTMVAPGTKKRDAAVIAGGTAAGAVLGEIIGDSPGKGAVIGGAAGTGVVLATKGKEITLPAGTRLRFTTKSPLEAEVPIAQKD